MGSRCGRDGAAWTSHGANPAFNKRRLGQARGSSYSQGVYSTGTKLRGLPLWPTTGEDVSVLLPVLLMRKTRLRAAGSVQGPASCWLCPTGRAPWAKKGGALEENGVWGRASRAKGTVEGGRTQGCGEISGSQLGTVPPAPTIGI